MNIEDIKQADLQKATKDINKALELGPDLKQNHVAGRQVLVDFIVKTIDGCIGPDPENEGQEIWTNPLAGNLAQETQDIYLALTAGRNGGEPEAAEAGAETQSPEAAAAAAGQPEPATNPEPEQACEDFGKAYDPNDPACAQGGPENGPCGKADECAQLTSKHLKTQKAGGGKGKKTDAPKSPPAERYGYVNAAHDAIMAGDASRDELAAAMVGLMSAKGKTADTKQARRNLDSDLRSLLTFGVVREEGGKIILTNRQ